MISSSQTPNPAPASLLQPDQPNPPEPQGAQSPQDTQPPTRPSPSNPATETATSDIMLHNATRCDTFSSPTPDHPLLSTRQNRALILLIEGRAVSEIASELEVCRQTIHRWKSSPAFARTLARLQADHLHAVASEASRVLIKSLSLLNRNIERSNCLLAVKILTSLKAHRFINPPTPDDPADPSALAHPPELP